MRRASTACLHLIRTVSRRSHAVAVLPVAPLVSFSSTPTPTPSMAVVNLTADGGITKEILREGDGDMPSPGSNVKAHYTGTLLDGTVFDSSVKRGRPFTFTIGIGQVIKGWDIGIASMRKGEKCVLTCKPEYAYGRAGAGGVIPGGATLKFEVELLDFI